ncbi:hypothetical protein PACILC2_21910 [Paenibacillus cisolokensis]|uniref:ADP ribosyltransferase domain-containing protein n=1 Tax=Paenibacillus cisolokensis TaxID=1658519 RepID=A0ABQ4N5Y2_9BACL|nr:hypothetical protein PACILC2_21910 [Paenibacillus cisolokensis]
MRDFNPTDEIIEFTEKVAGALSKFSLAESIVVWRGLEVNIFGTDDPKQLIGSEYDDPGFFSTSLLRETAFKGQVLMIVHLPAGSAGAPITYMSQIPGENEFLLPPGVHYVILDAWKEKDILIVVVEVVDE